MYDFRMHVQVTDRYTGDVLIDNIYQEFKGFAPSPFLTDESARRNSAEALATNMFIARFENTLLAQNQEYAKAVAGRNWYINVICHFDNPEPVKRKANVLPLVAARPCPDKIKKQAEDINSWINTPHNMKCVPYWAESELGAEHKFRIENITTHEVVVEALQPEFTDGHTCSMFLIALEKQKKKSFQEGLKSAAAAVYSNICKTLGINAEPIPFIRD